MDLRIENARIPHGESIINAGVAVEKGKIVSIARSRLLPEADRRIDLNGSLLLPGIVDPHVHFRDPGLTQKEDFSTGSKAAAAGGVTTVCDMPNTLPMTDSLRAFEEKIEIAESKSYVDFGLHAALPRSIEEGKKLAKAGATSFKLYPELREDSAVSDFEGIGLTISVHPEDPEVLGEQKVGEGGVEDFLKSRPQKAETSEISRLLSLTSEVHLHFCHTTLRSSLNAIAKAKMDRKVTFEVTPHHLLLTRSDLREIGPLAKTYPPLRSEVDRASLFKATQVGLVDMVATDHAPHTSKEKREDMMKAPPGISGVETSLPLLFTLVRKGKMSIFRLVDLMCSSPARAFDLRNDLGVLKGSILPGADADFVALDQDRKWRIKGKDLHGKSKLTPFEGRKVIGKPFLTLVRGKTVFEGGEIVGKEGYGRFFPRETQA